MKYIKVFGERNSGTNFINQLFEQNIEQTEVLDHGPNDVVEAKLATFFSDRTGGELELIRERLIDARRGEEFPQNYGWKHSRVTADKLKAQARYPDTAFIFLTRNPYTFVQSLHKKPYNLLPQDYTRGLSFSDFIRCGFLVNDRDSLVEPIAKPLDFWNWKTASYIAANEVLEKSLLIRYEDLVMDPIGFLKDVHTKFGIPLQNDPQIPFQSTKGDARTFPDFQDYVRTYDPTKYIEMTDLVYLHETLDTDICATLGYEIAKISSVKKVMANLFKK